MNRLIRIFAIASFALVGCGHAAERTQTAVKAVPHQVALEKCLSELQKDHSFDYKACADKADADAGRK